VSGGVPVGVMPEVGVDVVAVGGGVGAGAGEIRLVRGSLELDLLGCFKDGRELCNMYVPV
jgi:hypothetical protein